MFDSRGEVTVATEGIIAGWLSKEKSEFFDSTTGEPAALWRLMYDIVALGEGELEEHKVLESIDLMSKELPCIANESFTLRQR